MRRAILTAIVCLELAAMAQEVHYDYDRSADFKGYKTYQWVDGKSQTSQLTDQNIKRAVDSELMLKGLQLVESGGDLQISYSAAVTQERQFEGFGTGPRWFANGRVTSSTIETGKLVIDITDPHRNQLVWRGWVSRTLDISKDPDKNYRNLQKATGKLFRNFPPNTAQR